MYVFVTEEEATWKVTEYTETERGEAKVRAEIPRLARWGWRRDLG